MTWKSNTRKLNLNLIWPSWWQKTSFRQKGDGMGSSDHGPGGRIQCYNMSWTRGKNTAGKHQSSVPWSWAAIHGGRDAQNIHGPLFQGLKTHLDIELLASSGCFLTTQRINPAVGVLVTT